MSPDLPPLAQRELDAIDAALEGRPVEADLADVAELTRALHAERPAPSPDFARELDERAAAGWPRARPALPRPRRTSRRRSRLAVLLRPQLAVPVAALAAVAVGISALPNGSDDSDGVLVDAITERRQAERDTAASGSQTQAAGQGEDAAQFDSGSAARSAPSPSGRSRLSAPPSSTSQLAPGRRSDGRSVERSASMMLATLPDELESVAAGVARVAERADGYVAESSVTAAPDGGSAEFMLRVPSARLGAVLADISKLADVRSRTQAADDITAAVASTSERVADLRAERRGLRRRLARTGEDAVRDRLRFVTAELARARAQLRSVRRRADLATVQVTLTGDPEAGSGAAADDGRWGPGDAVRDAGRVLEWMAGVALVGLAAAVPFLLIGLPLLLAGRWRRERLRERTLDAI